MEWFKLIHLYNLSIQIYFSYQINMLFNSNKSKKTNRLFIIETEGKLGIKKLLKEILEVS